MSQSTKSIDQRAVDPVPQADPASARWKVSSRILRILQEDRQNSSPETDPWRSRSSPVPVRDKPRSVALQVAESPEPSSTSLTHDDRVPAWLVSLILHCVLVLLLALVTTGVAGRGKSPMVVRLESSADTAPLAVFRASESDQVTPSPNDSVDRGVFPDDVSFNTPQARLRIVSPAVPDRQRSISEAVRDLLGVDPSVSMLKSFSGGKLGDRSADGRRAAIAAGETTLQAEDAMELALRWLVDHQHNDGGWSFRLGDELGPCHGQCDNPIINEDDAPLPRTAATGLTMLALMGAGYNHLDGRYSENLRRGIYYLRSQAKETSLGTDLQNGSMYGHGIATLALAEAYAITADPDLFEFAKGTTFFCAGARHQSGGWGYQPGGPADITLTAWQVIACKTAELRGIKIPTDVFPKAKSYIETLRDPLGVRYGYKTPQPELPTTAIGIALQLYLGTMPNKTELREGLDYLASEGPSPTNVYYNYYAMLALHHSRHHTSMEFAKILRDHLLATQAQRGHEIGSWHFEDRYGSVGGRLYTTAMCCLILQTPYRYVPLHE